MHSAVTKKSERQERLLENVQVLRALAALLVLAFHTTVVGRNYYGVSMLGGAFDFGGAGVDVFFVLSGFIIYYIHHKDLDNSSRFRPYVGKRLVRVIPLYWLVTGAIIVTSALFPFLSRGDELVPLKIVKSLFLIPDASKPILGVGWTLAHEMLFYGLFSLLILTGAKWVRAFIAAWCLALLSNLMFDLSGDSTYFVHFVFHAHNLQFVFGCVVGWLILKKDIRSGGVPLGLGIVIFIFSGVAHAQCGWSLNLYVQYGVSAALMIYGAAAMDLRGAFSPPRIAVFLGTASYSIYLTHLGALNLLAAIAKKTGVSGGVPFHLEITLIAAASLGIGCLVHLYVETPLLRLGRRYLNP